ASRTDSTEDSTVDTQNRPTSRSTDTPMDFSDALSELADIRVPGDVSWWPLAPGWWVLLAVLVALATYGAWRMQKRRVLQRRLGGAVNEITKARKTLSIAGENNMDQRLVYVNTVNAVLRRVAMLH